jgi:D-sedoheptulose 7-phosphate isomerase
LIKLTDKIKKIKKYKKKIIIFGNGGSSSISSHFSVDLTKNGKVRCLNLNEYNLITCFSNDYGFEKWIEKALYYYADKGDLIILISSSGNSKNMLNAAKFANKKKLFLTTFTGMKKNNSLKKLGDLNLWVDSKAYNMIENIHQMWLLAIVDMIIGKHTYSTNR